MLLCTSNTGPYSNKVGQVRSLPVGTFITWGYRPKWIHPKCLEEIRTGDIRGERVTLCIAGGELVSSLRKAKVLRAKDYSCSNCGIDHGFVRFDLELVGEAVYGESLPRARYEGYLVLP